MQVLPDPRLTAHIKHYLFLRSDSEEPTKFRLFSDGNMGMVFSLQSQLCTTHSDLLPSAFIYGQSSSFREIYSQSKLALVIVVFQPYGIHHLLELPATELQNTLLPVEDILGRSSLTLQEQLHEAGNLSEAIELLNAFFLKLDAQQSLSEFSLVPASIEYIQRQKGLTTVQKLVAYTGYSERHLERKFTESIGLSPKNYINLTRLHTFLNYLKRKSPTDTFTSLAYAAGYTDQAHLIREFRKYTGLTPTEYAFKTRKLAINFIHTTETNLF